MCSSLSFKHEELDPWYSKKGDRISDFKLVGVAYTVKMVSVLDTSAPSPSGPTHFVDQAPAHSVILIETPEGNFKRAERMFYKLKSHITLPLSFISLFLQFLGSVNAVWGGLLTARSQQLNVRGVVLDGRCRDIEELQASQFPARFLNPS